MLLCIFRLIVQHIYYYNIILEILLVKGSWGVEMPDIELGN